MDLKLVERFVMAMMPPKGKPAIDTAFDCMRGEPVSALATVGTMIARFQEKLYSVDEAEQALATHQLLTGIMICWCTERDDLRKYILEDYLKRAALLRGDNILEFSDEKAKRK